MTVPSKPLKNPFADSFELNNKRIEFLNDLAENPHLTASLGIFVVYEQLLEQKIRGILTIVYSHKAFVLKDGITLISRVPLDHLTLGGLENSLRQISFYKRTSEGQQDIIAPFVAKLHTFKKTRNDYIHKLLEGKRGFDVETFEKGIEEAIEDLDGLIKDVDDLRGKIDDHMGQDGSLIKFVDSLIDK